MDKKKLIEVLAQDDETPSITAVVQASLDAMKGQFSIALEALLRVQRENFNQHGQMMAALFENNQQTLDRLFAVVDARAYATVVRDTRRRQSPVGPPRPSPKSSSSAGGPSVPGVDDDVDMDGDDGFVASAVDEEEILAGQNIVRAPDGFQPKPPR